MRREGDPVDFREALEPRTPDGPKLVWLLRTYPVVLLLVGFLLERYVISYFYLRFLDAEIELFVVYQTFFLFVAPILLVAGWLTVARLRKVDRSRRLQVSCIVMLGEILLMAGLLAWFYPAEIGGALKGV